MSEEEFLDAPFRLGTQMAGEQAKTVCDKFETPSPRGMPLEWKIGEFQFDPVPAIWEKMEVYFGSDGMPQWPCIVLQPEARAELLKKLRIWHNDAECRNK